MKFSSFIWVRGMYLLSLKGLNVRITRAFQLKSSTCVLCLFSRELGQAPMPCGSGPALTEAKPKLKLLN